MKDELDLEIDGLAHDGRGVAHLDAPGGGRLAVFVAGALPGMLARCRLTRHKASMAEAQATAILRPMPGQIVPECPHTGSCGGCPLMAMPYGQQLAWKERLVMETMSRIGGLTPDALVDAWRGIRPSPQTARMRNKMEFAFGAGGTDTLPGLRARASHEVVATPGCILMSEAALRTVRRAGELAGRHGLQGRLLRNLVIREGFAPGGGEMRRFAILLTEPVRRGQAAAARAWGSALLECGELAGFAHETRRGAGSAAAGERRVTALGSTTLELPLDGRRYALDIASFFQVNAGAAQELVGLVRQALPFGRGGLLLDLFCGVGAPGQALAGRFDVLHGLERDGRAIDMARRNARAAGLDGCRYAAGDAAGHAFWANLPGRPDCVLADPPRQGLPRGLAERLAGLRPRSIVYISCNPATLARDIARLGNDYRLDSLAAVDLFPHSAHVECVAGLVRKGSH